MKSRHRPRSSLLLACIAAGLGGFLLFGAPAPIVAEPPGTAQGARPLASEKAEPLASAAPDSPEPGAARRDAPEEDEADPVAEGEDVPAPQPAPPEGRWDVPPRPATVARLAQHRAQLQRLARSGGTREVAGKDSFDIVWAPDARAALRRVKESAVAVVEARLAEAASIAGGEPLPEGLTPFFTRAFLEASSTRDEQERAPVGSARSWLAGRLFGVLLSFPITGGSDDLLALFEREGGHYRQVMVVARHDYASITEGQLGLDYVIRPVGAGYHVMTVHSSPWISSAWRGAHLRIFEPGPAATQPRVLLDEANSARIGESGADLSLDERGFSARFLSWSVLSAPLGDSARTQLHRFAHEGGRYRRVAPYVTTVRDLPDEWVKLPWSEAVAFTSEGARARLQPVHERLARDAEHLGLRGRMLKKTEGDRVRLRLIPDRDPTPIVFVIEGSGEGASIADVIEE